MADEKIHVLQPDGTYGPIGGEEPPKERNDGVMDMTYEELSREPLFDDRDDDWDD